MATPIQSPAKCEVRSVIRFLNAKGERRTEIHKQIVAVCGNVMNRQNVTKWCREFSEGMTDVHGEQRSGRPSLISDDRLQEIEGEIRANRRVTIRELHHIIPEVSKTTIREFLLQFPEEGRQRSKMAYRSFVRSEHQSFLRRIHGATSSHFTDS